MPAKNPKLSVPLRGTMAEKVKKYDWAATALGPMANWNASLRVAVNMILASKFPKCLTWGQDMISIYNDAFIPILGAKPEALGRSFKETWREVWPEVEPIASLVWNGESTFVEDLQLEINRFGFVETAFFTFCYSPVYDENGVVSGMLDTVIETTGKVLAERRLSNFAVSLEQEVQQKTLDRDRMWHFSTDLMLVAGLDGTVAAINPALTAQLGWSETELVGRAMVDFVDPADRNTLKAELNAVSLGKASFKFENRFRHKDGNYLPVCWTGVPNERMILAIGRDMSAEREAAAAVRRSELALQQAQKMDAIGKLTGGVAHDFNNLLQIISGNLQLLALDVAGNVRAEKRLEQALGGVTRGAKLASYLLAFSRRQTLAPTVIKIDSLILAMDDMLRRTLGEAIDIKIVVANDLWNTFVDSAQVENALLNLCINARDAMEGAGKLTIEIGNAVLDAAYARAHADLGAGQYVMIAVSDTGCGMSPEVMAQAFDPFFSTKPEGKGTGLGLSMVFGFVRQSGGHVQIYSEVGLGTTVKIYLPRCIDAADTVEQPVALPTVGGSETILVVEDDDAVRATVVEMLKELGYRVLKAHDAGNALAIVESGVEIDLLFTDVVMPGPLRSPELAKRIRQSMPQVAILFTSGYTENAIAHGGRLDVDVELLAKPYTREALARKVRHILESRQQQQRS